MKIGEVSLLTNDVVKMADFYKKLLETDNGSNDEVHQTLIGEETMLTIYNDGSEKNNRNRNICLAFTVDDIEKAYHRVVSLGAQIIEPPESEMGHIQLFESVPENYTYDPAEEAQDLERIARMLQAFRE